MTVDFSHRFTPVLGGSGPVTVEPSYVHSGGLFLNNEHRSRCAYLSAEDTIALRDSLLTLHPLPVPEDVVVDVFPAPTGDVYYGIPETPYTVEEPEPEPAEPISSTPGTVVGDRVLVTRAIGFEHYLGSGVAATVAETYPAGTYQAGRVLVEFDEPLDGAFRDGYADEWEPLETPAYAVGDRIVVVEPRYAEGRVTHTAGYVSTGDAGTVRGAADWQGDLYVEFDSGATTYVGAAYVEPALAAWEKELLGQSASEDAPEAPAPSWAVGDRVLIGQPGDGFLGEEPSLIGRTGTIVRVADLTGTTTRVALDDDKGTGYEGRGYAIVWTASLESLDERETPDFDGLTAAPNALEGFPIGARIRVLRDEAWHADVSEGDLGTVVEHSTVGYFGPYFGARMDESGEVWYYRPGIDAEQAPEPKPEFEVGDVVEITGGGHYSGYWATAGAYGPVVEVHRSEGAWPHGADGYAYYVDSGNPAEGDIRQTLRHPAEHLKKRGYAVGDRVMVDYCREDGTDYLAFLSWAGPATVTSADGSAVTVDPDHRPGVLGGFSTGHVSLLDETPGVAFRRGDAVVFDPKTDRPFSAKRGATATVTSDYVDGDDWLRIEWDRDALSGSQRDGGFNAEDFRRIAPAAK